MRFGWMVLVAWLLVGCQPDPYKREWSAFIVMKTPVMRYADQGFIYEGKERVKVEIYANAQPLLHLEITPTKVCTGTLSCLSRHRFNQEVLSAYYPDDTIEKIFRAQPIFGGEKLLQTRHGFTQHLVKRGKYDIRYEILNKQVQFRDTINHIVIKIKRF